jgi:hypothetical protein
MTEVPPPRLGLTVLAAKRPLDVVSSCVGRPPLREQPNMIGRRFGKLLVIEQVLSPDHHTRWRCSCQCGATTITRGTHLRSGHSRSCGCGRQAFTETGAQMAVPMIGKRYGLLTVIARAGSSQLCNDQSLAIWRAVCDCGNIKDVAGHHLRRGSTRSCGCRRRQLGRSKLAKLRAR